jgi:hypothetical protein
MQCVDDFALCTLRFALEAAMFELKPITASGIASALEKAERYRLLADPVAAESICLDVLELQPDNQEALVSLLLARTDQFVTAPGAGDTAAREVLPRLRSEYDRAYYAGLISERRGKAMLATARPGSQGIAWICLRDAMEWFEKAQRLKPGASDEAVLRWNTCARLLNAHPHLAPDDEQVTTPVLDD